MEEMDIHQHEETDDTQEQQQDEHTIIDYIRLKRCLHILWHQLQQQHHFIYLIQIYFELHNTKFVLDQEEDEEDEQEVVYSQHDEQVEVLVQMEDLYEYQ